MLVVAGNIIRTAAMLNCIVKIALLSRLSWWAQSGRPMVGPRLSAMVGKGLFPTTRVFLPKGKDFISLALTLALVLLALSRTLARKNGTCTKNAKKLGPEKWPDTVSMHHCSARSLA